MHHNNDANTGELPEMFARDFKIVFSKFQINKHHRNGYEYAKPNQLPGIGRNITPQNGRKPPDKDNQMQ
jgi:hypothetical protein